MYLMSPLLRSTQYIAGTFDSGNNGTDWNLIKLSPAGDTIFSNSFNGEFNGDDFVNAIAIDENDNVIITGRFTTGVNTSSVATYKINGSGEVVWQNISATSQGINEGLFILTDTSENVFIGGHLNAGGNSDVFLNKYNFEGTLQWSYGQNSTDKEVIRGLKKYNNGSFGLACNVFQSGNWDILLLRINASGTMVFEQYFNGQDTLNDGCNDIAIDNNNNAYITGYSTNNGNKDFVTIKWNESGQMEWFALFDETENDDEAIGIKVIDNYIIVSGNCLTGSSGSLHSDIVTILYDYRGVQQWKQKFNGKDSGNDLVVKLVANVTGNDFILAARVWYTETDFDLYLFNYAFDGSLLWSINYNDTLNSSNLLSDVAVDFLGNIYVTSNATDSNYVKGEVVKFNQPNKYNIVLKDFLKTLTVGLLEASLDTIVKNVVYEACATVIDSFFHIRYSDLISRCTTRGLNLQELMNNRIHEFFSLPDQDYVDYIFKRFWIKGHLYMPMLSVPHYHHFNASQLEADPKLAYAFEELNYPVGCLNCDSATINKEGTENNVTWLTIIFPYPYYYINGNPYIFITNCLASKDLDPSKNCQACPSTIPFAGIPVGSGGSGAQNWELNIKSNTDNCLYATHGNPNNTPNLTNYIRLSKLDGVTYFKTVTVNLTNNHLAVKKLEHPLMDKKHFFNYWNITPPSKLEGDILSICENDAYFNTWDNEPTGIGSSNSARYAIGYGLYQLSRPVVNQKPLYFYIPYQGGFWYQNGPDLGLYYGTTSISPSCSNGYLKIEEDYETSYCAFCPFGTLVFGMTQPTDYIATTDYNTIKNYWNLNVLTLGITQYYDTDPVNNLYIIEAKYVPQPSCTIPNNTTLISTFSVNSNGEYDIQKYLSLAGTYVAFTDGTPLYLQIKANFKNGEYIDLNKCITINGTQRGMLKVQIRGNIKDYDASVVNYEIKIYKL